MKGKNLLLASLASVALMSCSQADSLKENLATEGGKAVKLQFNIKGIEKAKAGIVAKAGQKSGLQDISLFFTKGGLYNEKRDVSSDALGKLTSQEGYTFENVGDDATGIAVVVNQNGHHLANNVKLGFNFETPYSESNWGAILPLQIGDIQPDNDGVAKAPMIGYNPTLVDTKTTTQNGNKLYTVTVDAKPIIARVQVFGKVALNEKLIEKFELQRIFLDNFVPSNEKGTAPFSVKKATGDDLTEALKPYSFFDEGHPLQEKEGKEVYAYHIFPQTSLENIKAKKRCVNLIIQYYYKLKDGREGVGYGTLAFAKIASEDKSNEPGSDTKLNTTAQIEAAKIYNINLGKIDWSGNGEYHPPLHPENPVDGDDVFPPKPDFSPDPTPNAENIDVTVIINPVDWTEETIIPTNM